VESQIPSGQKPSGPQKPPSKSDTAWISPRLREKLDEADSGGPKEGGPSPLIGIVLAVLVIGGGAALIWTMRSGAEKEKAAVAERARVAAAAAAADSIAALVHADSLRAAAVAESTAIAADPKRRAAAAKAAAEAAKAAKASASKPAPVAAGKPRPPAPAGTPPASPAAAAPTSPAAPKVVEKGPFGLDVGTFLVEDRAKSEQDKLAAATGLAGKVVTKSEDGSDVFHVVLGSFPTRAAAEKKAAALVAAGQVNQAKPVSLAN